MRNYKCDICGKKQVNGSCLVPYYYIDPESIDSGKNKDLDVCLSCREKLEKRIEKLQENFRKLITEQMESYLINLQAGEKENA
jgi:transcription elongation factor Elf1